MAIFSYRTWFLWALETFYSRDWFFWLLISPLLYALFYIAVWRSQRKDQARMCSDFENMTLEEAYSIKTRIAEHEFPTVFSAAIKFVFFKAEGVPSVAKLVARAAQRTSSANSKAPRKSKHGTSVAPADLLGRPGAPETIAAIDRVNHVHSLYRPSGKISDDDLLYVLSLFSLEPIRWIDRFEWRGLTAEECCALATLWKALGEELHIPFGNLPSYREGFRDALHWLAELADWGRQYEQRNREKSPESVFLAQKQLDAWVGSVPRCLKCRARGLVATLIEPGLRQATGIETPSATAVLLVETVIHVRRLIRRYFYH
ncbi:hypothetical protein F5Y12DRAFT_287761 [Xylaria sp. FL1777]|nr:hypothetical protein F5Y12DRAFT_287761 [Xylaria sp. FL1777]